MQRRKIGSYNSPPTRPFTSVCSFKKRERKKFLLLLEVAWRLQRPSLARLLHHHNSLSRAAASNFGPALHNIARRVFKKKREEGLQNTLLEAILLLRQIPDRTQTSD